MVMARPKIWTSQRPQDQKSNSSYSIFLNNGFVSTSVHRLWVHADGLNAWWSSQQHETSTNAMLDQCRAGVADVGRHQSTFGHCWVVFSSATRSLLLNQRSNQNYYACTSRNTRPGQRWPGIRPMPSGRRGGPVLMQTASWIYNHCIMRCHPFLRV